MRILLVDDESALRMTLAANLELEGFDVVEADSGARALDLLERESFDLVLTDIRMPGMNGVDLFRRIRRSRPEMPVILMTAFALEGLVDAAIAEGVFTVLAKPFKIEHAVATLVRAIHRPVVLIVDDPADDGEATAEALRAGGFSAKAARDEESALGALQSRDVDVCVVGLGTAADAGGGLVERVLARGISIAVIAVVWPARSSFAQRAATMGAFACLYKPLDNADLVRIIAKARGSAAPSGSASQGRRS